MTLQYQDLKVKHIYSIENGLIKNMEIELK